MYLRSGSAVQIMKGPRGAEKNQIWANLIGLSQPWHDWASGGPWLKLHWKGPVPQRRHHAQGLLVGCPGAVERRARGCRSAPKARARAASKPDHEQADLLLSPAVAKSLVYRGPTAHRSTGGGQQMPMRERLQRVLLCCAPVTPAPAGCMSIVS